MIVVFLPGADESDIREVRELVSSLGCRSKALDSIQPSLEITDFGGDPASIAKRIAGFRCVMSVVRSEPSHRILGEARQVDVAGTNFGGAEMVVMAGPCSVEDEAQMRQIAEFMISLGIDWLRGGAYKPSTSPYGFQGGGLSALDILSDIRKRYGLKVVTEVTDPRKVERVAMHADMLQIGARNMQNFDLLREVGQGRTPVLLKRGMGARIDEWMLAAEHVAASGNTQIVLCERGIRTFENATRATLDLAAVSVAKTQTGLPVVVDPSHAAGKRDLVRPLARAAVAAGADGLLIEVHPRPEMALKDGSQSLSFDQFESILNEVDAIAESLGRTTRTKCRDSERGEPLEMQRTK